MYTIIALERKFICECSKRETIRRNQLDNQEVYAIGNMPYVYKVVSQTFICNMGTSSKNAV